MCDCQTINDIQTYFIGPEAADCQLCHEGYGPHVWHTGWYFYLGIAGSLPDGPLVGPFFSLRDALTSASAEEYYVTAS
jgi:hypothetical protein